MQLGGLLSGAMVVEVVFGWKGMGQMMYNAVSCGDFATAQFRFLLSALCCRASATCWAISSPSASTRRIREEAAERA